MQMPPSSRRTAENLLYILIVLGCLWRVFVVYEHNPRDLIFSDTQRHWDHARDPLNTSPMIFFDPVVYQTWISVVQKITIGEKNLILILTALLSISCPLAWGYAMKEMGLSRLMRLFGTLILTMLPSWLGVYSYFLQETLFLPLLGISLGLSFRAKRKNTTSAFLWMIALWLLTGLTRGIAIPFAAFFGITVWWSGGDKLRRAAAATALLSVILLPLAWRAHTFIGLWSPHGSSAFNELYCASGKRMVEMHLHRDGAYWFFIFSSPSMDTRPLAPFSDWKPTREGTLVMDIDLRRGQTAWKEAAANLEVEKVDRWKMGWENLLLVLFGESWPDNNPQHTVEHLNNLMRWVWAPLVVVTIFGCAWRWGSIGHPGRALCYCLILWFYFQNFALLAVNEGRYRKPLEGILIVLLLLICDRWPQKKPAVAKPIATPVAADPYDVYG